MSEHRLAMPRHRHHEERARDLQKIADIILSTGGEDTTDPITAGGFAQPGEAMILRCIPVCTRGVAALIPGTDPLAELIAKETKIERLRLRQ